MEDADSEDVYFYCRYFLHKPLKNVFFLYLVVFEILFIIHTHYYYVKVDFLLMQCEVESLVYYLQKTVSYSEMWL